MSPFRRLVADLMHFSSRVPGCTLERPMDLGRLVAARQACFPRPSWCGLFTKAFAMLARDLPLLRQSYLDFPWARIYEHPHNVATINIERRDGNENIVLYCLIRAPENRSLAEIDALIQRHKEEPLQTLRSYQRAVAMSRIPWPVRRLIWRLSLNLFGRRRCHNFGTFNVTSVAAEGAGVLKLIPLLTSVLHYGLFDDQGRLDMRLSFDHRVLDGAAVARALADLEAVLNREILSEVASRASRAA